MKRILPLLVVAGVLAAPAISLAANGGAKVDARITRLETRVAKYEAKCEVANAPARCARVAARLGAVIDRMQARLQARVTIINQRCSAATAPRACANKAARLAKLGQRLARLAALETRLAG